MPTNANGAGARYRFERLTLPLVLADMRFGPTDPGPADLMPPFDLPTVDGGRFGSDEFGQRVATLVVFGSATCPVTDNAAPGLKRLYHRFGKRVRIVMVYVREAHPGSSWPQPGTFDRKMAHAEALRALYGFQFEVAVDDINGTFHRSMSPKPNSAYLVDRDGTILFRAHWANDTRALERALEQVMADETPSPSRSGGMLKATSRMMPHVAPALDRAGSQAWRDLWRVALPIAAMASVLKILGPAPRRNTISHSERS